MKKRFKITQSMNSSFFLVITGVFVLLLQFVNCAEPLDLEDTDTNGSTNQASECDPQVELCEGQSLSINFTTVDFSSTKWVTLSGDNEVSYYSIEVGGDCSLEEFDQNHRISWRVSSVNHSELKQTSSDSLKLSYCYHPYNNNIICDRGKFYMSIPLVQCDGPEMSAGVYNYNPLVDINGVNFEIEAKINKVDADGILMAHPDNSNTDKLIVVTSGKN